MIIKGGTVFQEDKTFAKKDIYIENGRIVEVGSADTTIDATGLFVLPGLIDIHSHGAVGHDFSDGDLEGLKEILAYQYAHGVTSYCPTSMTLDRKKLLEIFSKMKSCFESENISSGSDTGKNHPQIARVAGINMEGPFLDPLKKGAHMEEFISLPDVDFFHKCNEACGNLIRLITIAPNVEGAIDFIQEIHLKNKLTISLGHTAADYDTAKKALAAGTSHVTHLFNAMSPMNHREPGLIGAAAEDEDCMAELICDGVHVHESMVRAAFKLFPGRIVLISDSMRATGLGEGSYDLGGQQVMVQGNQATLSDGTIAGSVTNLFDCMCKAIEFGIPAEEAVAAATINPARSIGIDGEVGSLTPGKLADIILVDKNWKLVKVLGVNQ